MPVVIALFLFLVDRSKVFVFPYTSHSYATGFVFSIGMAYFFHVVIIANFEDRIRKDAEALKKTVSEKISAYEEKFKRLKERAVFENFVRAVIREKSNRFLGFIRSHTSAEIKKKDVNYIFDTITQPSEQINIILINISQYFERYFIPEDEKINVTIMVPDGRKLKFYAYVEPPKSLGEEQNYFGYGISAAGRSWAAEDMVIVEDIEAEKEKGKSDRVYTIAKRDWTDEKGSLICFPVFDLEIPNGVENNLIYVVNIKSSKANTFLQKDKAHYEDILQGFAERIVLENRLLKIKEFISS